MNARVTQCMEVVLMVRITNEDFESKMSENAVLGLVAYRPIVVF